MGDSVNLAALTRSGESCLRRLARIASQAMSSAANPLIYLAPYVTAVEAHTESIFNTLVDESGVRSNMFAEAALEDLWRGMVDAWPARMKWLRRGFGIEISGERPAQDFMILVDARNAVIHGEGKLTDRQVRSISDLVTLSRSLGKTLDIRVSARALVASETTIDHAWSICRTFVQSLDGAVLEKYPLAGRHAKDSSLASSG